MILITCVDINNGMLFNNRRQSRDRILISHILQLIENKKLWINNFSKNIFENGKYDNLIVDEKFIDKSEKEDYCFVENISPELFEEKVDKIILYNWNRVYPADRYFNISLKNWVLESEVEIKGSSHDKIIQRIYRRSL